MRISQFPVITIERVLDTGLLPGMLERAMKACVTRSLPDAWLGFVHMMESRNMAVSDDFGAARHADTRQFLQHRKCRSSIRAAESRAGSDIPHLADSRDPACYHPPII
jgi:hypothetical protein